MGSDEADRRPRTGRRAILQTASLGLGLGSLLGTRTAKAAPEEDRPAVAERPAETATPTQDSQGPPGFEHGGGAGAEPGTAWLRSDGQRVSLGSSRREWQRRDASDVDGIPDDARRVPYAALQAQVQAVNADLDRGDLRIEGTTDADQPFLRHTGRTSRNSEIDGGGP